MTQKEKAKELINKMYSEITGMGVSFISKWVVFPTGDSNYEMARRCALIAVDEILNANPIIPLQFMLESEALDAANEYWQKVKTEIENL